MNSAKKRKNEGIQLKFQMNFLHPRYWGTWILIGLFLLLSFIPVKWRDRILMKIGRFIGRFAKSARKRSEINLSLCYKHLSQSEIQIIIDKMFEVVLPTVALLFQLGFRGNINQHIIWHGLDLVEQSKKANRNIIFIVPHTWAIDLAGILLASKGYPIAAFFHHQKNELVDWILNKIRLRFGGRLHSREKGIQAFIRSVREGFCGYYLPDEDMGEEQSVFVDFFDTYKATLPILGRLSEVTNADLIPLIPIYNIETSTLHLKIEEKWDDLHLLSKPEIATKMNEMIKHFIDDYPEQYMWVLKLLRTRKKGDSPLY